LAACGGARLTWTTNVSTCQGSGRGTGKAHLVPLSCAALGILGRMTREEGKEHFFGRSPRGYTGFTKPKLALDARIAAARRAADDAL
jgi:hypothetical protein